MKTNTCVMWKVAELHVMCTQHDGSQTKEPKLLHFF